MRLQNLHTHTCYCDGKDEPEVLIRRAIELGFSSLGFSGHIDMPFFEDYTMKAEDTAAYKKELARLREKYQGVIDVYTGIELDLFSKEPTQDYDYVIGSVHYVKKDGKYLACDLGLETQRDSIVNCFGGDALAYAKAYFDNVVLLSETCKFDFVGHFDLLTKYRDTVDFFDTESDAYRRIAIDALHTVAEKHNIFEINTGAISRGYRKTPYPDPFLLKEMKEIGAYVIVTSDCHNAAHLDLCFDECYEMLREHGFKSTLYRTKTGWEEQAI